jgi:hypothetical protein
MSNISDQKITQADIEETSKTLGVYKVCSEVAEEVKVVAEGISVDRQYDAMPKLNKALNLYNKIAHKNEFI